MLKDTFKNSRFLF